MENQDLKRFEKRLKMRMLSFVRAYNKFITWEYAKNLSPRRLLCFVHPEDRRLFWKSLDTYEAFLYNL